MSQVSDVTAKPSPLSRISERLRSADIVRFFKFGLVGGSGVFVNLGTMWLALNYVFAAWPEQWATMASSLMAVVVSIISNFVLNDLWTWADRSKTRAWRTRLAQYMVTTSVTILIQFASVATLTQWGTHPMVAQCVGIGLGMVLNYTVLNRWTFKNPAENTDRAQTPVEPLASPLANIEDAFK